MEYVLRAFEKRDLTEACALWNEIIADVYFPGDTLLSEEQAYAMFREQTYTGCAFADGRLVGLYILHPNGMGRLGHVANASFAVTQTYRGKGLGRALVVDCLEKAQAHGFRALQFNAVVAANTAAIALYLKLGFHIVGTIEGGYRMGDNDFADMLVFLKNFY